MRYSKENKKEYFAEYGKQYRAIRSKVRAKRAVGKPPNFEKNYFEDKYLIDKYKSIPLSVPPSRDNFTGTNPEQPIVCSEFGCAKHLTLNQQLFGGKCINHSSQKSTKPDVTQFIQYPHKKTG